MCKSNYKYVEFNLTQLKFEIAFNVFNGWPSTSSKNGQSVYIGKIFGQFRVRSTKLNAYSKAIW